MSVKMFIPFGRVRLLENAIDIMFKFKTVGIPLEYAFDFSNGGLILKTHYGMKGKALKLARESVRGKATVMELK